MSPATPQRCLFKLLVLSPFGTVGCRDCLLLSAGGIGTAKKVRGESDVRNATAEIRRCIPLRGLTCCERALDIVIQTGTTFGGHADNAVVRYRILPYYIEPGYPLTSCCLFYIHPDLRFIWIRGRIRITQSRHDVGQSLMLPANQDISWASIIAHDVRDAGAVVSLARGVYGHIQA